MHHLMRKPVHALESSKVKADMTPFILLKKIKEASGLYNMGNNITGKSGNLIFETDHKLRKCLRKVY